MPTTVRDLGNGLTVLDTMERRRIKGKDVMRRSMKIVLTNPNTARCTARQPTSQTNQTNPPVASPPSRRNRP